MNVKTLVYLVVILMVINIAALATIVYQRVAPKPDFPPMPEVGPMSEQFDAPLPESLDLSEEQLAALRASRQRLGELMRSRHEQIREKRRQLMTEMAKVDPDTTMIFRLVEEIGRMQTDAQRQAVQNILKDGVILSPEQRKMLLHEIENRAFDRARQMFDGRGGGRRGRF